jgi:hypothetical protein
MEPEFVRARYSADANTDAASARGRSSYALVSRVIGHLLSKVRRRTPVADVGMFGSLPE